MPKNKTKKAAVKRVRVTGTGKLTHDGCGMRHNLEHKSAHKRRALSRESALPKSQAKNMSGLLG